jgi:ABC-type amino acid transport substrate-binding protein
LQQDKSVGWQISQFYQPKWVNANSIGARKGEEALVKKIDVSLAKFKADGTVKAIFAKFGIEGAVAN